MNVHVTQLSRCRVEITFPHYFDPNLGGKIVYILSSRANDDCGISQEPDRPLSKKRDNRNVLLPLLIASSSRTVGPAAAPLDDNESSFEL